ncbi:hypothetical protein [Sorlinia euscelidii]|uniref:Uncharacterized protein n=1 Tax=Sorlinia euscelidii TaxID=3081148 RepID=A0ABU7U5E6_9PROT
MTASAPSPSKSPRRQLRVFRRRAPSAAGKVLIYNYEGQTYLNYRADTAMQAMMLLRSF